MPLLGPTHLFIFGKSSHLHSFLRNTYQNLLPTRLLGTTRFFIFEANSQLSAQLFIFNLNLLVKRGFDFWDKERMKTMVIK